MHIYAHIPLSVRIKYTRPQIIYMDTYLVLIEYRQNNTNSSCRTQSEGAKAR